MSEKLLRISRSEVDQIDIVFLIVDSNSDPIPSAKGYLFFHNREEENAHLEDNEFWLDFFGELFLTHVKPQILEAIRQMRENDTGDGREQTKEIVVPPKLKLKPHSSCKMNQNVVSNGQAKTETEDCQSELKQKLSTLDKNTKVLKTFKDNKCSVCLSDYKEILDEDNHIVIPSCGHPLCCKCADGILDSEKKECPQCRGQITLQSFNLMNFNADLEVDTENQRVFL